MPYRAPATRSGYGLLLPILLAIASLAFFLACLPLLGRNEGYFPLGDAVEARVIGYAEDMDAAEGQVLRLRLYDGDRPRGAVITRDDRPWRTFQPGERVALLGRPARHGRSSLDIEYIVDDFAAKWGGLIARATAAVLCDIAAVGLLLLARRRPSAALRYPPPLPRRQAGG